MNKFRRLRVLAAVSAVLAVLALSACSSSLAPSVGQYGIATGQGLFSNQMVKDVIDPGTQRDVPSGDTEWYLPATFRNYVSWDVKNADRSLKDTTAVLTGGSGNTPGMSVKVGTYIGLGLNPNHASITRFFARTCLKYGCASQEAQDNSSNAILSRSSDPGWFKMLDEIMPTAIDQATRDAVQSYGPDLWLNQGEWGDLAAKISKNLFKQISLVTGSETFRYFCGPGSVAPETVKTAVNGKVVTKHEKAKCMPFTVLVKGIIPTDPNVVAAYNQASAAVYQSKSGTSRLEAAKKVYGKDAEWVLGMIDIERGCPRCTFIIGNGTGSQVIPAGGK